MGTAALGIVGHAGTEVFLTFYRDGLGTQYLVTGDGILSVLEIDQLQGAVVVVRTEGQTDVAFFVMSGYIAIEQGDVALLHLPFLELFL